MKLILILIGVTNLPDVSSDAETVCYGELGCFPNDEIWFNDVRPYPLPASPNEINAFFYFCTRANPDLTKDRSGKLWPELGINSGLGYNPRKWTVFIVHGFAMNGPSMSAVKDGYLKRVDANVFMVDYSDRFNRITCIQGCGDIRVVGALLARFAKHLVKEKGQSPKRIHCIGHSLGGQVCGYLGKLMKKAGMKISWITGLDAAGPGYDLANSAVKLAPDDADYTEAYHTNALPLVPFIGLGIREPAAHVDFFVNGGKRQPGCSSFESATRFMAKATSPMNLKIQDFAEAGNCDHMRAIDYYAASMEKGCAFVGTIFKFDPVDFGLQKSNVFGIQASYDGNFDQLKKESDSVHCNITNCHVAGFDSRFYPGKGVFYVETGPEPPFCVPLSGSKKAFLKSARKNKS